MEFLANAYGETVARLLALDGDGARLMPLAKGTCSSEEVRSTLRGAAARTLFPSSFSPEGAVAGLWLYFSCLDEAHTAAQELETVEGSFWHAILHRQEPDAWNSGYWFRRVGRHPVFPALNEAAATLRNEFPNCGFQPRDAWDPMRFIDFVEEARRRPGSDAEQFALRLQSREWQLLFDYCARSRR